MLGKLDDILGYVSKLSTLCSVVFFFELSRSLLDVIKYYSTGFRDSLTATTSVGPVRAWHGDVCYSRAIHRFRARSLRREPFL